MKIVQLTDPHLVPTGTLLRGIDPEARLRACLTEIEAHHLDAAALVVSGDVTDLADRLSYELFRDILSEFVLPPLHVTVGNHDRRSMFAEVFPEHLAADGYAHSRFRLRDHVGLLLDTWTMGTHGGAFDTVRLEWIRTQLAEGSEPILMFMHHAPIRVGLKRLDRIALQGEDEFWDVIAPFKSRIRHMFFGHMHRNVAGSWRGIPFTVAAGLTHQVMLDFQTDIVRHIEVEPYFSIILVNDRDIVVHPHAIRDARIIDIVPDTTAPPYRL
ncbi:3',5'-cyclic adenosine monophosphate phosphodiesterase CpdA [Bradyrhizobium ivorense]|uniref:3',5'-cyclic adenosine monophosphate phosphodiesterase CpdA n=1 Tax=Bradyrhizobium ivorense TaxID=2511166 RepID=A0A508T930_9BRAD|nr:metallophosphoesterase [Bradyrhizobium ivorense]VIO70616.1 3',5'-cyclic adenosine monophosphate phosphodiesterase CpdA [Bradyrhizobium ivorense]